MADPANRGQNAEQWRRDMKNLVLAGALVAVLVSPAFAENPRDPNDPYNTNEEHLSAQSRQTERGVNVQASPQVRPTRPAVETDSTVGLANTNDGPNGTVIRDGEVVGQDPDPTIRAMIGQDYDQTNQPQ
jgi:hypothetical protein